ncbi:MAG: Tim17/Tim22/Tim23/Pmp24 domain-containing protein [Candidatus Xenobia bacterium]
MRYARCMMLSSVTRLAQPRPDTTGNTRHSSPISGAISGGLQGFFSAGVPGAVGGAVGAVAGVKTGESTSKFTVAAAGATLAGAAGATAVQVAALAAMGLPVTVPVLIPVAIAGGMAGVCGTITGGRMARIRDGAIGGFIFGAIGRAVIPSPLNGLAAGIAGGIGSRFDNRVAGTLMAGVSGGAMGALLGLPGGPHAMLMSAALCGITGALGTAVGPPMQQINRNLTADLRKHIEKAIEPVVDKAGPAGLLAIGTVGGAVSMAPMGVLGYCVFGVPGAVVPLVLGGGAMAATMLRARHAAQAKREQPQVPQVVATPQDLDALIAAGQAAIRQ